MARTFDTTSDTIFTGPGLLTGALGPFTIAAIVRRNTASSSGVWRMIATLHTSGTPGTARLGFGFEDTGQNIAVHNGTSGSIGLPVLTTDGWAMVAASKASGTVAARLHRYLYGTGVHTHANGSGTMANTTAVSGTGVMKFSQWAGTEFGGMEMAVVGVWLSVLSDDQVESLAYSRNAWLANSPAHVWMFDQASTTQALLDITGNGANQTSITGTAVSTVSVPLLSYDLAPITVTSPPSATEITLADGGDAATDLTASAATPLGDAGAGSDTLAVTVALGVADAGAGVDQLTVAPTVPLGDTGAGSDLLAATGTVPLTQAGSAADQLTATPGPLSFTDTGTGGDTLTTTAALTLPEGGSAADSVTTGMPVTIDDAGSSSQTLTATATAAVSDAGAGADQLTAVAAAGLADGGSVGDAVLVVRPLTVTDVGAAGDALTAAVTAFLADAASSTQTLVPAVTVPLSDAAAGDVLLLTDQQRTLTDAAGAADTLLLTVSADIDITITLLHRGWTADPPEPAWAGRGPERGWIAETPHR